MRSALSDPFLFCLHFQQLDCARRELHGRRLTSVVSFLSRTALSRNCFLRLHFDLYSYIVVKRSYFTTIDWITSRRTL
jgi:hypothetical protein